MNKLNRRKFLGLGGILALTPFSPRWAKAEESNKERFTDEDIKEVTRFTARSDEGKLQLEVELLVLKEEQLEERQIGKGHDERTTYYYQGKKLPDDLWPRSARLITKFDFFWDKQQIEIPRRFWEDLPRFRIQTVQIDRSKLSPREQGELIRFERTLKQPRVSLSADGGTALIEWVRGEDCDSHSTTRWIISRTGTVLRHRHQPLHEC